MAGRLAGRTAVITGAAGGIGAATAGRLGREGARLVLNDRDASSLDGVVAALSGVPLQPVAGDAADPDVAARIAAIAVEAFGAVDIVIHSAGTAAGAAFADTPAADFDALVTDSVGTTLAVSRACLEPMRAAAVAELTRDGAVAYQRKIVASAGWGWQVGEPGQAPLSVAAGAVLGLVRTLARELGPYGINVNAVIPGFIDTPFTAVMPEPLRQMTKAMTALGRLGTPDDVAAVHCFLASPDADFITGAAIPVTGGLLGTMAIG